MIKETDNRLNPFIPIQSISYCVECGKYSVGIVTSRDKKGRLVYEKARCKECGATYELEWTSTGQVKPLLDGVFKRSCSTGKNLYV